MLNVPRLPATLGYVRMIRILVSGFLAVCVAGVSAAPQQPPTFRGSADNVRVFTTVTDRDGRLVTTLEQKDFEIRDEGKPQPITLFDNSPQPIRLIVLLDVSGSMQGNLQLLRDSTSELFTRLRVDDAISLGSFGYQVTISPTFTGSLSELRAALPRDIAPEAPTPLWSAVGEALEIFRKRTEDDGRAVILVLSDGKDTGPADLRQKSLGDVERKAFSQAAVIDRARERGVMVYGIGMRSRPQRPATPGLGIGGLQAALMSDWPDPGLAKVAEETGGGYTEVRAGHDLGAAFAQVADELHSQYLLGFAPPKRDGKVHQIDVRTIAKGLKPRARKTYVAPAA
jgi:Ca-activated chloride channel homolog